MNRTPNTVAIKAGEVRRPAGTFQIRTGAGSPIALQKVYDFCAGARHIDGPGVWYRSIDLENLDLWPILKRPFKIEPSGRVHEYHGNMRVGFGALDGRFGRQSKTVATR